VQLPDGVVSRMQYSPYRLQLAGVRTAAAAYLPLVRKIAAVGVLEADGEELHADLELPHEDAALVQPGHAAEVTCEARPGQGPWPARVRSVQFNATDLVATANVHLISEVGHALSPGMEVTAHLAVPLADYEPFRSQPTDPEPLGENEPRRVFVCPDHADVVASGPGKCPRDELELVAAPLTENQRLRYWCPMHPLVTAVAAGHQCQACGGMELLPRVVTYRPGGQVLAVPTSAIIDTGGRHVVYVDRGAGMFDGVEVVVGPGADGYCSIVSGLAPGESVASAGAFLLDAETRLHANLATAYFGATTNPAATSGTGTDGGAALSGSESAEAQREIDVALADLPADDQEEARRQRVCPVTDLPLGSMGKPEKLVVEGRVVFICCEGCRTSLVDEPNKYLPKLTAPGESEERP
jgi:hypothetical protein